MSLQPMRATALILIALVALTGCSSAPVAGTPSVSTTAAAPTTKAMTPEEKYLADVLDTPGLTTTMSNADIIGIGRGLCDVMQYQQYTRSDLIAEAGTSKLGPAVTTVVVNAAHLNLCPQYQFPGASTAGRTAASGGAPTGPLSTVGPGTYEVGTGAGQIPPGKYQSPGPTSGNCYYARLKHNDGAVGDIIGNDLTQGPSIMNVKASDGYVEVRGCTFTKS